ncbi:uncharacterized protein EURHEDRAFT_406845 [Aspergillus ruber CBS 135680]|uniref:Uncharacterized protein n=1 Tax=Aspergillus ruber (strain CBS 135680) TaxID=1388766 RepID=A0A017S0Y7_ASPRC|nr:uncharacterized protein EURHEDRAFT_406845 [Aspergillus ruber CBS 135680]EYE90496.1 hypothetical protein EURHEDRAFT_406845 [Aspergillus ruber CBS 135680]
MAAGSMMTTDWFVYVDPNEWNLGQLITVTIWAPPIVKYLYWSLFGIESYPADPIPFPYKIINTDPNSSGGSVIQLPRVENLLPNTACRPAEQLSLDCRRIISRPRGICPMERLT